MFSALSATTRAIVRRQPYPLPQARTINAIKSRAFSSSSSRHDFHFDTHHFVQRLESEGLNRAQAEGIMKAMAEVIDESVRNMTGNMVTKSQQEKVCRRTTTALL
jgi:hypothetical protein